jgi:hypothetical protein
MCYYRPLCTKVITHEKVMSKQSEQKEKAQHLVTTMSAKIPLLSNRRKLHRNGQESRSKTQQSTKITPEAVKIKNERYAPGPPPQKKNYIY